MKKKIEISAVIVLMAASAALTFLIAMVLVTQKYNDDLLESKRTQVVLSKFLYAKTQIENSYVGDWDEEKLVNGATLGLLDSLAGDWAYFMSEAEYSLLRQSVAGSEFVGIGILPQNNPAGGIRVGSVFPLSAAEEAGLQCGDIIREVAGLPIKHFDTGVSRIRGVANTTVELTVYRPLSDETIRVTVTRRDVKHFISKRLLDGGIGYMRIYSFEEGADIAFVQELEQLKATGMKGIIFDLRGNPGGQLRIMLEILDGLLGEGNTIAQRSKNGREEYAKSDAEQLDLPMVVITDSYTASMAEYFAAVLREYNRVVTIGETTAGKGYQEVAIPLSDGSAIMLPTTEYFLPSGRSLNGAGLEPDYPVEMPPELAASLDSLEPADDPQIVKAVQVLRIQLPGDSIDLS